MIIQSKSLDEITKLASKKEKLLKSIPAIQPINNNDEIKNPNIVKIQVEEDLFQWWDKEGNFLSI